MGALQPLVSESGLSRTTAAKDLQVEAGSERRESKNLGFFTSLAMC